MARCSRHTRMMPTLPSTRRTKVRRLFSLSNPRRVTTAEQARRDAKTVAQAETGAAPTRLPAARQHRSAAAAPASTRTHPRIAARVDANARPRNRGLATRRVQMAFAGSRVIPTHRPLSIATARASIRKPTRCTAAPAHRAQPPPPGRDSRYALPASALSNARALITLAMAHAYRTAMRRTTIRAW